MNRGVGRLQHRHALRAPYGQQWTHLNAQTQEDLYLPSITALGQLSPRALRRPDGPSEARQDT